MRIRAITPITVSDDELERRRSRYHRLSPAGVLVELENLRDGPRQLETVEDVERSDRLVLDTASSTDPQRYDLVLPDCVLDPGVRSGKETPVPVVGILALSAAYLAALGRRFSAVTRNQAIGDELVRRIGIYGLQDNFAGLDVLELDFAAISDEARWHDALRPARTEMAARGVDTIINGCSAVEVPGGGDGAALIDPTRLALALLSAGATVVTAARHRG